MKSRIMKLVLLLLIAGIVKVNAQGFESQFVPGLQVGTNSVKTSSGKNKFGTSLAVMEFDHVGSRMYWNVGLSDGYYRLTSINKQKKNIRDSVKPLKSNGQLFGMRWGMVFGKGEFQRMGFSLNGSWSSFNGSQAYDWERMVTYGSFGGGLVYYRKIGKKLNVLAKLGYEMMKGKSYSVKGRLIYMEASIAYELYQKFGVCVQPAFYSRKTDFMDKDHSIMHTGAKVTQFALKVGIARFLR